jgi:uncharacterized protein HemX
LEHLSQALVKQGKGKFISDKAIDEFFPDIQADDARYGSWVIPSSVILGGGGLYGGWKLADWLMNQRREQEFEGDLDEAKTEYQEALAKQYQAAMLSKTGSALDELIDEMEKRADLEGKNWYDVFLQSAATPFTGKNFTGGVRGAWLTLMLAALGTGAYGSYRWTTGRSRQQVLRKALEQRAKQRLTPQPIMAVPAPIEIEEEDEAAV